MCLLLVGVRQYHCVILWAVSTFITKAFIAASCHGVVLWVVRHRRVFLDPHVSLTQILCHFRTLLPFACSHDFSLRSSSPASQCHSHCGQVRFIAHVHDLLPINELSFQLSNTKRHHARSQYRRSNTTNPLVGSPFPTLSVHCLNLGNLFLYHNSHNSHINNFVSVLILGNLDVLGLLVDPFLGDGFRFSARSS